ncbi:MAG: hypothetical protein IJT78_04255 [Oscillospiraceae bacterium]|nr:hypothetical protein [Oscillospiraceae bacterium]
MNAYNRIILNFFTAMRTIFHFPSPLPFLMLCYLGSTPHLAQYLFTRFDWLTFLCSLSRFTENLMGCPVTLQLSPLFMLILFHISCHFHKPPPRKNKKCAAEAAHEKRLSVCCHTNLITIHRERKVEKAFLLIKTLPHGSSFYAVCVAICIVSYLISHNKPFMAKNSKTGEPFPWLAGLAGYCATF